MNNTAVLLAAILDDVGDTGPAELLEVEEESVKLSLVEPDTDVTRLEVAIGPTTVELSTGAREVLVALRGPPVEPPIVIVVVMYNTAVLLAAVLENEADKGPPVLEFGGVNVSIIVGRGKTDCVELWPTIGPSVDRLA